jgi:hypothetical protein
MDWTKNFGTAVALAEEIDEDLKQRSREAMQGHDVARLQTSLQRKVRHLETSCAQLDDDLAAQMTDPITYRV